MKKTKIAEVENLLDSDDEFPMEYYEEPSMPAYKNDYRFDMIQFKWINTPSPKVLTTTDPPTKQTKKTTNEIKPIDMDRPIVTSGVLSKRDLYCIKSIEGYGDSILIWFINFLILKDLQSNYVFLKSCLVNNDYSDNFSYSENKFCKEKTKNLYKLNIKA